MPLPLGISGSADAKVTGMKRIRTTKTFRMVSDMRWKLQTPTSKSQTNSKLQFLKGFAFSFWCLEICDFLGAWNLDFGIFAGSIAIQIRKLYGDLRSNSM
jgi:hypothetical protein